MQRHGGSISQLALLMLAVWTGAVLIANGRACINCDPFVIFSEQMLQLGPEHALARGVESDDLVHAPIAGVSHGS